MKKVLHLQNHLNIACGVSKNIYLIIKNSDANYKHFVAAFDGDGFDRFKKIDIYPRVINANKIHAYKIIKTLIFLIGFCKKNNINIIHSHHRFFDTLVWCLKKNLNVKTVMSVQSKVYGKRLFSYKSEVIVPCAENIKKHLINYFKINSERINVIYNCIDITENNSNSVSSNLKDELYISQNAKVIGYFGRFSFLEKGLDLLLRAFIELIPKYENIILLLIGKGPDQSNIYDFQRKYSSSVRVLDSQTDLSKYFQLINIFVLPSRVDPFPLVMLEAGYYGVPFIGAKVDGIAELIINGETGLLFEKDKTSELIQNIKKLLDNEDYAKKLKTNLYNLVTKDFSTDKVIPKYFSIYESLTE